VSQHVRVLEAVVQKLVGHPCASTFWKIHEQLEDANDPFDPEEVECYPIPGARQQLRKEHFLHREAVLVYYWQHPDGDVEIHDVVLPEEHEGSSE
jgi:hypothetical protein